MHFRSNLDKHHLARSKDDSPIAPQFLVDRMVTPCVPFALRAPIRRILHRDGRRGGYIPETTSSALAPDAILLPALTIKHGLPHFGHLGVSIQSPAGRGQGSQTTQRRQVAIHALLQLPLSLLDARRSTEEARQVTHRKQPTTEG